MTRAELLTIFERYLKRNDLTDLYSDFIRMAEARINAVVRLSEMEVRSTSTPTEAFWALPDDFIEMRHIQAAVSRGDRVLEYLTPEQADNNRLVYGSSGGYRAYSILDNQIEIIPHPTADSETVVEMFYYAKPAALANAGDTNDVVTNYPNLYLYAMLGEAALYREAAAQAEQWLNSFDAFAKQLNTRAQTARFSGDSLQMRAV
ncbi:MAG: phage adaptor protein [Gammaproteobacteria bacterium]